MSVFYRGKFPIAIVSLNVPINNEAPFWEEKNKLNVKGFSDSFSDDAQILLFRKLHSENESF